jgi:hypothetical protein
LFKGLTWEQLVLKPTSFFGTHGERVQKAIDAESDETDSVDQLILEDIAIFTGQKPLGNCELAKYRLNGEGDEF